MLRSAFSAGRGRLARHDAGRKWKRVSMSSQSSFAGDTRTRGLAHKRSLPDDRWKALCTPATLSTVTIHRSFNQVGCLPLNSKIQELTHHGQACVSLKDQKECSQCSTQIVNGTSILPIMRQYRYYGLSPRTMPLLPNPSPRQTKRWMSSNGNKENGSDKGNGSSEGEPIKNATGTNETKPDAPKELDGEKSESLDPRAFLLGTREHLRKVTEWEVGDMVATYSIVLLLAMILLSPIVGR